MKTFTFHTGRQIPAIAFGTGTSYFHRNEEATKGVIKAYENGYRSFDTAIVYETEEAVGKALSILLNEKGVKREDIFVNTKVFPTANTYEKAKAAIESSLKRLGLDYLNMCLIHMPGLPNQHDFVADQDMDREKPKETYPSTEVLQERRISMWQALQDLKKEGKIRDIGVSNFSHKHIEQLLNNPRCKETPVINQIEFNPYCVDKEIIETCKKHGILIEAYAPLGSGDRQEKNTKAAPLLSNEVLLRVAKDHQCTPAQVAIGWAHAKGAVVVTKTENEGRMRENLNIVDLKEAEIEEIDKLNFNFRVFRNPHDTP